MKTTVNITNTRQWDRHILGVPVAFTDGGLGANGAESCVVTKNVSAGGVLLTNFENEHKIGEHVTMEFIIPDDEAPKIKGTVLRASEFEMAIEFNTPHPWLMSVIAN